MSAPHARTKSSVSFASVRKLTPIVTGARARSAQRILRVKARVAYRAFLEAEHDAWQPARMLASTTHALLETLRDRGLRTGLVSNAFDPPELLHRDLARLGVAERLDVAVFSSEVGRRKPDPLIFERALEAL